MRKIILKNNLLSLIRKKFISQFDKKLIIDNLQKADELSNTNDYSKAEEFINLNLQNLTNLKQDSSLTIQNKLIINSYLSLNFFNLAFIKQKSKKEHKSDLDQCYSLFQTEINPKFSQLESDSLKFEIANMLLYLNKYSDALKIYIELEKSNIELNEEIQLDILYENILTAISKDSNNLTLYYTYLEKYSNKNFSNRLIELAKHYEHLSQEYLHNDSLDIAEALIVKSQFYYKKYSDIKEYLVITYLIQSQILIEKEKYSDAIVAAENYIDIIKKNRKAEILETICQDVKNFHILASYYLIASSYYHLDNKDKAKEYYLITHKEIFDKNLEKSEILVNLVFKTAIGNIKVNNLEESLIGFDYVINNSKNGDQILNSMFNKGSALFKLERYEESKREIYKIVTYGEERGIKLKKEKMDEVYVLLTKIEMMLKK